MVDVRYLEQLQLRPVGEVVVQTVGSDAALTCEEFEVALTIAHRSLSRGKRRLAKSLPVLKSALQKETGDQALLGLSGPFRSLRLVIARRPGLTL